MTDYRFVTKTNQPDLYNALVVSANCLEDAMELIAQRLMEDEDVVSINMRSNDRWLIIQGIPVSKDQIEAHPKATLGIAVDGDATQPNPGDPIVPVLQPLQTQGNRFPNTPTKSAVQRNKEHGDRVRAFSRTKRTFSNTVDQPPIVTALWVMTAVLGLGGLLVIFAIDYQYTSGASIIAMMFGAMIPAIITLIATFAMHYLSGIYFTLRRMEMNGIQVSGLNTQSGSNKIEAEIESAKAA